MGAIMMPMHNVEQRRCNMMFCLVAFLAVMCILSCTNTKKDIEQFLKKEIVAEFSRRGIDAKILDKSLQIVPDGENRYRGSVGIVIDGIIYDHSLSVSIENETIKWQIEETETSASRRAQDQVELKQQETKRIEEAQRRQEEERRRQEEERHRYDWLQGHWYANTRIGVHHAIIEGNTITEYTNDGDYDINRFVVEDGKLGYMWQGMYVFFEIDERQKRIKSNGQYYQKIDNNRISQINQHIQRIEEIKRKLPSMFISWKSAVRSDDYNADVQYLHAVNDLIDEANKLYGYLSWDSYVDKSALNQDKRLFNDWCTDMMHEVTMSRQRNYYY